MALDEVYNVHQGSTRVALTLTHTQVTHQLGENADLSQKPIRAVQIATETKFLGRDSRSQLVLGKLRQ